MLKTRMFSLLTRSDPDSLFSSKMPTSSLLHFASDASSTEGQTKLRTVVVVYNKEMTGGDLGPGNGPCSKPVGEHVTCCVRPQSNDRKVASINVR